MVVVVEQVGSSFKAFPKEHPSEYAYGTTQQEALGNMLASWQDELGIAIEVTSHGQGLKKQVIPQGF